MQNESSVIEDSLCPRPPISSAPPGSGGDYRSLVAIVPGRRAWSSALEWARGTDARKEVQVRFAVVGLGGAAGMFHVPALQRLSGSEPVGGCDLSAERRADFERATGA